MKLQGILQAEGLVTQVADVLVVYVRLWDTTTIHEGRETCVCVCVCVSVEAAGRPLGAKRTMFLLCL